MAPANEDLISKIDLFSGLDDKIRTKLGEVDFAISEHTIVKGRSYYVLSRFPFVLHSDTEIHLVRFDKSEKSRST